MIILFPWFFYSKFESSFLGSMPNPARSASYFLDINRYYVHRYKFSFLSHSFLSYYLSRVYDNDVRRCEFIKLSNKFIICIFLRLFRDLTRIRSTVLQDKMLVSSSRGLSWCSNGINSGDKNNPRQKNARPHYFFLHRESKVPYLVAAEFTEPLHTGYNFRMFTVPWFRRRTIFMSKLFLKRIQNRIYSIYRPSYSFLSSFFPLLILATRKKKMYKPTYSSNKMMLLLLLLGFYKDVLRESRKKAVWKRV